MLLPNLWMQSNNNVTALQCPDLLILYGIKKINTLFQGWVLVRNF